MSIIYNFSSTVMIDTDESLFADLGLAEALWRFVGNKKEVWFVLKKKEIENGSNAISLFSSTSHFGCKNVKESDNFLEFVIADIIPHTEDNYKYSRKAVALWTEKLRMYLKSQNLTFQEKIRSIRISEKELQKYSNRAIHWDFAYHKPEDCNDAILKELLYSCIIEN